MPDPILVEEKFQALAGELDQIGSIRRRISLIREFLLFLGGSYGKYESYILELIEYWPIYSGPMTYSGISPAEVTEDLKLLEKISSEAVTVGRQEKVSDITGRLREVAAILYIYLGEFKAALNMLEQPAVKGDDETFGKEREKGAENRNISTLHNFKNALSLGYPSGPGKETNVNVDRMINDLDYILKQQQNQNDVLVPVVESFESFDGKCRSYGRLRRLKVRVNDGIEQNEDRILRRYNVLGVEKPSWLEDTEISLAARSLFIRLSFGTKVKHYSGEIYYEYSGALHQGNSSNAATAALWFTGLQKKEDLRERYQIRENIVITGDIDSDGNLLPVSENSIKAKVHAAFYSWATTLIVPALQADLFREELFILQKKHPHRELTLLAPERLDELFYDRRISTHLNPSKVRYAAGQLWEKKFETVGVITILLLSLAIFRLANGPLDKNPVLYEFKGEMLRVLNQGGALIEEIYVGESTVKGVESIYRYEIVDFTDITGNGVNEIIWAELSPNSTGKVLMKEVNKYTKSWEKDVHYNFTFPNKPYVFESNYKPRKIVAGDLNNDGEINLLINSSHSPYFPSVLSLRNALTGDEISHFVHPGRILDFTLVDLTGDGRLEVVICGINNDYDQAFLAILDIDNLQGYGPSTDEYSLEGYTTADMFSYILFPKTDVANAITTIAPYNQAERVHFIEDYGLLQVFISDFKNYDGNNDFQRIERAPIYVYINEDLSIHGIGTSDEYDITAEYLFNNGIIDQIPDHEYFKEYQRSFLYWNGEEFIKNEGNLDLLNLNSSER